jgi:hypothetical protein
MCGEWRGNDRGGCAAAAGGAGIVIIVVVVFLVVFIVFVSGVFVDGVGRGWSGKFHALVIFGSGEINFGDWVEFRLIVEWILRRAQRIVGRVLAIIEIGVAGFVGIGGLVEGGVVDAIELGAIDAEQILETRFFGGVAIGALDLVICAGDGVEN